MCCRYQTKLFGESFSVTFRLLSGFNESYFPQLVVVRIHVMLAFQSPLFMIFTPGRQIHFPRKENVLTVQRSLYEFIYLTVKKVRGNDESPNLAVMFIKQTINNSKNVNGPRYTLFNVT